MSITELCHERRATLLPRWTELFFAAYPLSSPGFLRTQPDPFANPVGRIVREALPVLFDAVAGGDADPDAVNRALADLMRLRAVQDMPPSQAIGPIFLLKTLLREVVLPEVPRQGSGDAGHSGAAALLDEYLAAESRVDSLGLMALDLYAGDREQVFNLRVEEIKRSQSQLVRWATLRQDRADGITASPGDPSAAM
ncbi:MAG: RsbRD N-terminal domain-containing protein [Desulfovibrionaceae bacterium]|nr:RsbRD N-terminal domain-containing protein [Desulfovibrionaceae bacterium]